VTSGVTTHVLDMARGSPASGVAVTLQHLSNRGWDEIASGFTNSAGRLDDLVARASIEAGHYRLVFETGAYFERMGDAKFYPAVRIEFEISDPDQRYHLPLVLSPFGYSTYRGS